MNFKYKPGDKFIIEIEETADINCIPWRYFKAKGLKTLLFDEYGLDQLKKYDEEKMKEKIIEESECVRFYYCASEDAYWIGQQHDDYYYGEYEQKGFTFNKSKNLPWGKTVNGYTYPSEPVEIDFFDWLQEFIKKYLTSLTLADILKMIGKE